MQEAQKHIPVMLCEVLEALSVKDGGVYVDATFGDGGYSRAILEKANCRVIALDRDPAVLARAQELKEKYAERFDFRQTCFSAIFDVIDEKVDGVVFDIGVSSMQLDEAERGFSFSKEATLDMRMSQTGLSAYDIVNTYDENELADILYYFGEEKKARQIAKKIVLSRQKKPIETTTELAEIICCVLPVRFGKQNPATRSFQALRIAVNDELSELEKALNGALEILDVGARLVVVDFHSLEDRIVKNFLKANAPKKVHTSRYGVSNSAPQTPFSFVSDVVLPTKEEISSNPRAHSAKLRYAIKSKGEKND